MTINAYNDRRSFLGTGWGFPPTFSKTGKCTVRMVMDEEDIQESLHILLTTEIGERVMRPDYGCNLSDLLFDPMNTNLVTYVKDMLSRAIIYHEPRIELLDIQMDMSEQTEGRMIVSLFYAIRSTNSRFNMVYDFYKKEVSVTSLL